MRLDDNEIEIIKSNILKYIDDAKIMLFGSRADDAKRGGDIDIFIQTKHKVSLSDKLNILSDIEIDGIERKVDLVIKTPFKKRQSIFEIAEKEGIIL